MVELITDCREIRRDLEKLMMAVGVLCLLTPTLIALKGDHMLRIPAVDTSLATGSAKQMLDAVQAALGVTPNVMRTLANAPAALTGALDLAAALARGVLDRKFREQIALAVAETNACGYCVAAHSALGAKAGLTAVEISASRNARAADAKRDAGLKFARAVVVARGQATDAELAKARAAGLSDVEITEIVAHVALNVLTNCIYHVARATVDFRPVDIAMSAA